MKITLRWLLLIVVMTLPLGLLTLAGTLWLWERELLLAWFGVSGVIALASWLIAGRLQESSTLPPAFRTGAASTWSAEGTEAWKKVEQIAQRVRRDEAILEDGQALLDLLKEIVQTVARHFHPTSKEAILEVQVPYFLRVIELLALDLRVAFTGTIPGSHVITVSDILRGHRLALYAKEIYGIYRLLSFGLNPASALLREARELATGRMVSASAREIKQWLVEAYVKKVGYYAIELYSGHIILDDAGFRRHITAPSRRDLDRLDARAEAVQQEPLRILVIGQVKAGKSSLINALFGQMKALVDVVPLTAGVTPYLLVREGLERAIILDTAGYEQAGNPLRPLQEAGREILRSDLVLLVCSATSAARQADKRLVQALQAAFREQTREAPPPVVVVLTHIDQLRPFRQWNPPYNVAEPAGDPKARAIRNAIEIVAADLEVEPAQVVPVSLLPGREYNIDEGLIPAILERLDAAQRLRYLRCLKDFRDEGHWRQVWEQSKNLGKILARQGAQWVLKRAGADESAGRPPPA